jgi:hypothetical protein
MSKVVAAAITLLFVGGALVPLPGGALADRADVEQASASADAETPTIEQSIRLHLTPSEAGRIDVTVTYDVPEELTSLRVQLPDGATDVTSESFTESSDGYEWDGDTDPAELRFTIPANRSSTGAHSDGPRERDVAGRSTQDTYSFVDAGSWALVTVPQLGTEWSWRNARDVTLTEDVAVDGEGSTGGEMAYLGSVEVHTRTANGQTFTLAVPERASMSESPGDVLDALSVASNQLRVGERDAEIWITAAPRDAEWIAQGIEYGGSDFWVVANAPLDVPGNVWLHEYVHTRQAFTTASSARWTTEATADYYAALLALEAGDIGFEAFRTYLGRGDDDPWRDAVLARPETWARGANYVKGSLVWGELDRRVRLETNSSATMTDVLWRLNQQNDQVSNDDVLAALADVSSNEVAGVGEQYTETPSTADMWSRFEHRRAFDTDPPLMQYDVQQYRVTGPFRNQSFDSPPTLYVGETLGVVANVTNAGGADGEYAVSLASGSDTLVSENGSLRPSETATLALEHEFEDASTYNLSVGRNSSSVVVEQPQEPQASDVSVSPSRVRPGESVTVTATLSSSADAPAAGTVEVTLDGDRVGALDATLAAGDSVTRSVNVTVSERGEHTIAVGDQRVQVTASDTPDSGTEVPGFGAGLGIGAFAAGVFVALLAGRER